MQSQLFLSPTHSFLRSNYLCKRKDEELRIHVAVKMFQFYSLPYENINFCSSVVVLL